jgi:hypothetical protein
MMVHACDDPHEVGMRYRMLAKDPNGAALEASGQPIPDGASMMYRLLTDTPGLGRRQRLAGEEEPYTFVEALAAGRDPRWEGLPWPNPQPRAGELQVASDWSIQVAAPASWPPRSRCTPTSTSP